MSLSPSDVVALARDHSKYLDHNAKLIDIFEGNLSEHLDRDMKEQFSPQMLKQARYRVAPINILPKIIDKLTNIYSTSVNREVIDGTEGDKDLLALYQEKMRPNVFMGHANELFNLCKAALVHPYAHMGQPCLRVILNDRFVVYSSNPVDPTYPTDIVLLAGKDHDGKDLYWHYSLERFLIVDSEEKIRGDLLAAAGNPEGVNPIAGKLPFVYINESHYRTSPKQEADLLKLSKLVPLMLTDLNTAAFFQSFSVIYGIDLDNEGLQWAPNAFWTLKSDPTSDKTPQLGMLKPQVDYDQVLNLIQSELSLWMGTKGIRSSTVGALTTDTFASGISKIIDEMDTFEARNRQIAYFQKAECELWELVFKHMQPYWVQSQQVENKALFTATATVSTTFAVQLPMQSRGQLVKDLGEEMRLGFISRKRAMAKLNPDLTASEIDEIIKEVDATQEKEDDGGQMDEDQSRDTERFEANAEA